MRFHDVLLFETMQALSHFIPVYSKHRHKTDHGDIFNNTSPWSKVMNLQGMKICIVLFIPNFFGL